MYEMPLIYVFGGFRVLFFYFPFFLCLGGGVLGVGVSIFCIGILGNSILSRDPDGVVLVLLCFAKTNQYTIGYSTPYKVFTMFI